MKKKKKHPLLITSIVCFVSAFVLFFLMTFISVALNMAFYHQEVSQAYIIFRRAVVPLLQIGILEMSQLVHSTE